MGFLLLTQNIVHVNSFDTKEEEVNEALKHLSSMCTGNLTDSEIENLEERIVMTYVHYVGIECKTENSNFFDENYFDEFDANCKIYYQAV
jgi:hypothetical protein